MYKTEVVENGVQAKEKVKTFLVDGYTKEEIHLFAHDKDREKHLAEVVETGSVGIKEQGLVDAVGNIFKSRGDELRSKFESLGLTADEADRYEKELDEGKLVLVASKK